MKLIIHTFRLTTRKTFTTSHGSAHFRNALIIELIEDNHRGYGEATEILYYAKDINKMIALVKKHQTWIESLDLVPPTIQYQRWYDRFKEDLFVVCALDMAYHDLWGKLHQKTLIEQLHLKTDSLPLSSLTVGIDSIENMVLHIHQNPWPIYKIKLGTTNDMEIMQQIRDNTDKALRVDVNAGWSATQTIAYSYLLKDMQVDYIEQPLPIENIEDMAPVYRDSALPVFADESCHTPADIKKCIGRFHGINIKLMKCGGLTPALEMIHLARQENLQIMIGCMTETSIGISALGQLLPLVDFADMDGSLLISNDPAKGVYLDYGRAIYPHTKGTGAELIERNEV